MIRFLATDLGVPESWFPAGHPGKPGSGPCGLCGVCGGIHSMWRDGMREHVWRGANGEAWTPEAPTDNCSRCGGTPDSHPTMERAPKWDANWPAAERLPEEAWQAVRDEDWQVLPAPDPIRGCRFHVALRTECRRPAVARMQRNRAEHRYIWRHYCEQHMFNRWIENGLVLNWTVRPEWRDARVPA